MPEEAEGDQWLIEELVTQYSDLEQDLRQIFVEGPSDQSIIAWFLEEHGLDSGNVLEISSVFVPSDIVKSKELEVNARGRVIALGIVMSELLDGETRETPICVADRDDNALLGIESNYGRSVLFTDYTSMEMYAFNERSMRKILRLTIQKQADAEQVLAHLAPALIDIFLVRTVLHRGWRIKILKEPRRCCRITQTGIEVDWQDLATRSLTGSSVRPLPQTAEVVDRVETLRQQLPSEPRLAMHGHDFGHLFWWYTREALKYQDLDEDIVNRIVFTAFESGDLSQYPLFTEILRRMTTPL
ncbi:MAG: hypothetical protein QOJ59_4713 [Thermomicrobiales bacterium]|jgi:hypothetical protein|nr:hypothetical protein [Thermomicrobiales bacterium]